MTRQVRQWVTAAVLFAAFVLIYGFAFPSGSPNSPPLPRTVVTVDRVVDGDTIVVSGTQAIPGDELDKRPGRETVRLIGVDTPETVWPGRPVQCFGPEASAYTKAKLPQGITVTLAFDAGTTRAQLRDRTPSHRLLAYVWLTDNTMHNLNLVRGGYALASHYKPQDDYRTLFKTAQDKAKQAGKGRWSACGR